jgi:hypothetical protein
MRWKISSLEPSLREQIVTVGQEGSLRSEACCFYRKRTLRALVICTIVGAMLTALSLLISVLELQERTHIVVKSLVVGLSGLTALWTLLLLVESVRVAASRLKPFILITPRVLLEVGADHDYLAGYRLRDATDFKAVDQFSGANFQGRRFYFTFPNASWSLLLKDAKDIQRLEQVLGQARSGAAPGSGGLHLLPGEPGLVRGTGRAFTNPFGEGWLGIGAVLLLGLVLSFFGSVVYSVYVGRH